MEPITAVAGTVVALIFSEALKEGGKALGKGVSDKVAQLMTTIRQKFKESNTEGVLIRAENQPTESNIEIVEAELVTRMNDDKAFAEQLAKLVKSLEQVGVTTRQVIVHGIKASNLEAEDITQEIERDGFSEQKIVDESDFIKDVKLGNLTQKAKNHD